MRALWDRIKSNTALSQFARGYVAPLALCMLFGFAGPTAHEQALSDIEHQTQRLAGLAFAQNRMSAPGLGGAIALTPDLPAFNALTARFRSLRDALEHESVQGGDPETLLNVTRRYVANLAQLTVLYLRSFHQNSQNPNSARLTLTSFSWLDSLSPRLSGLTGALYLQERGGFARTLRPGVYEFPLTADERSQMEQAALSNPRNALEYARFVQFTTLRRSLINRWALTRVTPAAAQQAQPSNRLYSANSACSVPYLTLRAETTKSETLPPLLLELNLMDQYLERTRALGTTETSTEADYETILTAREYAAILKSALVSRPEYQAYILDVDPAHVDPWFSEQGEYWVRNESYLGGQDSNRRKRTSFLLLDSGDDSRIESLQLESHFNAVRNYIAPATYAITRSVFGITDARFEADLKRRLEAALDQKKAAWFKSVTSVSSPRSTAPASASAQATARRREKIDELLSVATPVIADVYTLRRLQMLGLSPSALSARAPVKGNATHPHRVGPTSGDELRLYLETRLARPEYSNLREAIRVQTHAQELLQTLFSDLADAQDEASILTILKNYERTNVSAPSAFSKLSFAVDALRTPVSSDPRALPRQELLKQLFGAMGARSNGFPNRLDDLIANARDQHDFLAAKVGLAQAGAPLLSVRRTLRVSPQSILLDAKDRATYRGQRTGSPVTSYQVERSTLEILLTAYDPAKNTLNTTAARRVLDESLTFAETSERGQWETFCSVDLRTNLPKTAAFRKFWNSSELVRGALISSDSSGRLQSWDTEISTSTQSTAQRLLEKAFYPALNWSFVLLIGGAVVLAFVPMLVTPVTLGIFSALNMGVLFPASLGSVALRLHLQYYETPQLLRFQQTVVASQVEPGQATLSLEAITAQKKQLKLDRAITLAFLPLDVWYTSSVVREIRQRTGVAGHQAYLRLQARGGVVPKAPAPAPRPGSVMPDGGIEIVSNPIRARLLHQLKAWTGLFPKKPNENLYELGAKLRLALNRLFPERVNDLQPGLRAYREYLKSRLDENGTLIGWLTRLEATVSPFPLQKSAHLPEGLRDAILKGGVADWLTLYRAKMTELSRVRGSYIEAKIRAFERIEAKISELARIQAMDPTFFNAHGDARTFLLSVLDDTELLLIYEAAKGPQFLSALSSGTYIRGIQSRAQGNGVLERLVPTFEDFIEAGHWIRPSLPREFFNPNQSKISGRSAEDDWVRYRQEIEAMDALPTHPENYPPLLKRLTSGQ